MSQDFRLFEIRSDQVLREDLSHLAGVLRKNLRQYLDIFEAGSGPMGWHMLGWPRIQSYSELCHRCALALKVMRIHGEVQMHLLQYEGKVRKPDLSRRIKLN